MRSFWRLLLVCLMALALPVQGFAAAGGANCGAMHERMHAALAQPHHHHDGAAAADHHHARTVAHAIADADAAADGHDVGHGGLSSASKCSACAACCVALGLPATALLLPAMQPESAQPTLAAADVAAFLTSGPERPPRSVLA